ALDKLDREIDLALALGRRGDRVAPLGPVAIVGGQPDVVVLARAVRRPPRQREGEALDLRRLRMDRGDRGELPLEGAGHESPLYRSSFQGSPWLLYPSDSQKPGRSSLISLRPRTHFALFQKYRCGTTRRAGPPWSAGSGL